ncbi:MULTISPECIES: GDSL-type esterase/lipase family protein [Planktothrix]|jgi:lysophospholipase L1-like esterase|uniref:Lipolytic enzyme, G-D-S-L n=1 Tax=Planktothrix agardhii TaxID=1160 RepID=A0A1J1JBB8_PLAAG|nr:MULTISPECIES: GDSL-type esterase/lipase family protein [Planktothrix]MCF3606740.1 GDSL-type esterase/lipase family protein [Planktothrix agardhii 1033]BBD56743.1 lipolytic enzyme, G-D-S-L [Planktothrix agardhii NIES-204]MBG0745942.1 G-D-S-L family lipolytic protein [Planktothrix agardhii KL2]MCB8750951.1 GDSL-type esterase/lipase family protein [Planktothrix agardhii 1810]MCB8759693.1 GDSL-type esterase/lipase family protein [Planktothrix agardhii 1813]
MQAAINPTLANLSIVPQRQPLKVVVLGDSLVYGFGDPEGGGWVERLRRQWMSPESVGPILYNLGVRGNRVIQVCDRLDQELRHRGELRNRLPDVSIFSVGLNDSARVQSFQGRNYTEFDHFETTLNHLLDQAEKMCQVVFVGMVPVDESKMPFQGCLYYTLADQFRYKDATRLACLDRNIPYLDLLEIWTDRGEHWWKSRLCSDGLHPNVAGYEALLQDIQHWEPIQKLAD